MYIRDSLDCIAKALRKANNEKEATAYSWSFLTRICPAVKLVIVWHGNLHVRDAAFMWLQPASALTNLSADKRTIAWQGLSGGARTGGDGGGFRHCAGDVDGLPAASLQGGKCAVTRAALALGQAQPGDRDGAVVGQINSAWLCGEVGAPLPLGSCLVAREVMQQHDSS